MQNLLNVSIVKTEDSIYKMIDNKTGRELLCCMMLDSFLDGIEDLILGREDMD